jgi:hypothetical protein
MNDKRNYPQFDLPKRIPFPYKSKVKINKSKRNDYIGELYNEGALEDNAFEEDYISDTRLKPLKKYYRPSFSPKFNSWIIDLVFIKKNQLPIYFFIININTRYLVVYEIKSKSGEEIYDALVDFLKNIILIVRIYILKVMENEDFYL